MERSEATSNPNQLMTPGEAAAERAKAGKNGRRSSEAPR